MELKFVLPGHYISKDTINSDDKEMIRVLGESDTPNYFNIANQKRPMHEQEILSRYIFMQTSITENQTNFVRIGDLDDEEKEIENLEEEEIKIATIYEAENSTEKEPIKIPIKQNIIEKKQQIVEKISEEEIFVNQLLTKIKDENNFNIEIPINFVFEYNIDKLKNLINILDVDKKSVNLIVDKLLNESLKDNIFKSIKSTILNIINNNITEENNIFQPKINIESDITIITPNINTEKTFPKNNNKYLNRL